MKKILGLAALSAFIFAGTASMANEAVTGVIYKNAKQPGQAATSTRALKVGMANCKSYFGIVATGNCSINEAMKNGKISVLSYYDEEVKNLLGFKSITVKAYGQ